MNRRDPGRRTGPGRGEGRSRGERRREKTARQEEQPEHEHERAHERAHEHEHERAHEHEHESPTGGKEPEPLAVALGALLERLGGESPAGFDSGPLRAARDRAAEGQPPELPALCAALAAAESALEAGARAGALPGAASPAPEPALLAALAALGALGVTPLPLPGAQVPAEPLPGRLDLADDPAPPGTLLRLGRRGFRAADGRVLLPVEALVSRGRPTPLEALLDDLARGEAPCAALAAELLARASGARDARARGEAGELARIEALRAAAEALLRAWPDLPGADDPLAARLTEGLRFDPELGPFPPQEPALRLSPQTLRESGRYELIPRWSEVVPAGRALRLLRPGLRELRPGGEALVPARVEVSLGPRPALDRALEGLAALWPDGGPELDTAVNSVREAVRALVLAELEQARGARLELARAAAGLFDLLEVRADGEDATGLALRQALDGPLGEGLAALGVTPLQLDDALRSALLRRRFAWSELPAGEELGWARRGLRVEDVVVRPGEVRVSAGPRGPLGPVIDALAAALEGLPEPARGALSDRVGLERAIEADRLHGRPTHGVRPARDRALGLLDALEAALPHSPALEGVRRGPLASALAALGLAPFPDPGALLAPAERADAARYARVEGRADPAPRGTVLRLPRLGLRQLRPGAESGEPLLVRAAEVEVSLGPAAAALLSGALPEPPPAPLLLLRDQLLDPLQDVADDAPARAAFAARHGASAARSPALEALLRALEAEPFPEPRGPAPGPDEALVRAVPDEAPAGTLLRVLKPGLRWRGQVLERAEVEVSRGPLTATQRALAAAAAALPEADQAGELARGLRTLADEIEALAPAEAEARLAALLDRLEGPGQNGAGGVLLAFEQALAARGLRVLPEAAGEPWEALQARAPAGAFLPPRRTCGPEPAGLVVGVERRALLAGERVVRPGRVRVAAGRESPLHGLVLGLRPALEAVPAELRGPALEELDELLDRIAVGTPEREHLLALPVLTLLHRLELKEKLGAPVREHLREQGVREVIAYPNYEANKLGPTRLEEVRVSSDRPVGRIVRVLRPGFERADGTVLQKVRAEVSR